MISVLEAEGGREWRSYSFLSWTSSVTLSSNLCLYILGFI